MPGEVALRLLLKGQREVAAGLASVTKETGTLGKTAKEAAAGTKELSGGLDSVQKQGILATRSSKALILATRQVADAQQAAAAASKQAADMRLKAAAALADATDKQIAGDLEGAKAAKAHAAELNSLAVSANRSAIAMRASASAARDQVSALKSSAAVASMAGGGPTGRAAMFGGLAKVGGALTKGGLAIGGLAGYEGVKRAGAVETTAASLYTLANVPKSQIAGLQSWAISNSPRLREDPNTILAQMYRIASAAPGHPYSARQLESLASGAAGLSVIGGSTVDPSQVARVFGIIRANGGLGTKNSRQIAGIAASTVGSGDMMMNDYISAMGSGGLAIAMARHHISLLQGGGALAQMGDLGVTGSMAGNRLSRAISLLSSPSAAASKIYGSLGISPTMIDQVIRSKGLGAGLGLLRRQMHATMPANMVGQTASVADLMSVGYNRGQARTMQKSGPASMEDLMLTRAFGGARQATPIIALLQGLNRTNAKTRQIGANASPTMYNAHLNAALSTPAMQWKNFDLGVQKLETDLGLKLIPKLESLASWVERNKGDLEDAAKVIGVLAIPAIAAYAASLTMKGVTAVTNFSGALRGQNAQLSTVGQTAAAQSRGVGVLGSAVMGVTAAIGVFELGRATGSHGAGGAVTAGLGGAITGMTVGLSIGGPWGGAIGAAGGALVGLAGHFSAVKSQAQQATAQFHGFETQLDQMFGPSAKGQRGKSLQFVNSQLMSHPQVLATMKQYGVTASDIVGFAMNNKISPALQGLFNARAAAPDNSALASQYNFLTDLESAITGAIINSQNLNIVEHGYPTGHGHLGHHLSSSGRTQSGVGRRQAGSDLVIHNHFYVDGKEVQHAVHQHDRNQLARQ